VVDETTIPEALPKMPFQTSASIKESKFEEVPNAKVGNGTEIARQFIILGFARVLKRTL
jgi:hypothetical protein